jgi:hypothetical protein
MPRIPQPPSLESKSHNFGDKDPKTVACSVTLEFREQLFAFCIEKLSLPLVYLTAQWLRVSSTLSVFI